MMVDKTEPKPPVPDWSERQQMLTLSFLAYVGVVTVRNDPQRLSELIGQYLETLAPVAGQWRFAWGPAIEPGRFTDDHLAFAVQHVERPQEVVVVIRGTNPLSLENLLQEVGSYTEQVAWGYGHDFDEAVGEPKIASGVQVGIDRLLAMVPVDGLPGAGQTILEFCEALEQDDRPVDLRTTGHSLGGTLASTLALLLEDALDAPSVAKRIGFGLGSGTRVASVAIAGFTAGNADFARYSDDNLSRCDREHNGLDTVPRMYSRSGMLAVPGLYEPTIERSRLMALGVTLSLAAMAQNGVSYRQIQRDAPALASAVNPAALEFIAQMLWQHTQGYVDALGLTDFIDLGELFEAK